MRSIVPILLVSLFISLGISTAAAQNKNTGKELKAAIDRVDDSTDVITEIMRITEKSIPRDLLQKANAVVVFPGIKRRIYCRRPGWERRGDP